MSLLEESDEDQVEYEETKARFDTLCEKASQIYKALTLRCRLLRCIVVASSGKPRYPGVIHQRFETI